MLAEQKDIDGVLVATPDHTHAAVAMAAMSLGKHVYVQKPLCWSVHEARALAKKAAETKVATQMGNQGHSLDDARKVIEDIQGGYIGDVKEVHIWTNRPYSYWPQGSRARPRRRRAPWATATSPSAWPTRWLAICRCRRGWRGTCSSARRPRCRTTRFITRASGAAGSTGARARWATWART